MRSLVIIPTIFARPDLLTDCLARVGHAVVVSGGTFAENCNWGADADAATYVFLNDDTLPEPGWLELMLAEFANPDVGIVGCRLTYPDGSLQHAGIDYQLDGWNEPYNIRDETPSGPAWAVTGACMAIRRECWDDVGGFDTGYVNGLEDVDICLRAAERGWVIWYTADVSVVHYESQSGPARWTHVRPNIERFKERWYGRYPRCNSTRVP